VRSLRFEDDLLKVLDMDTYLAMSRLKICKPHSFSRESCSHVSLETLLRTKKLFSRLIDIDFVRRFLCVEMSWRSFKLVEIVKLGKVIKL